MIRNELRQLMNRIFRNGNVYRGDIKYYTNTLHYREEKVYKIRKPWKIEMGMSI